MSPRLDWWRAEAGGKGGRLQGGALGGIGDLLEPFAAYTYTRP